jgi:uncharacterized membrane protein
MNQRSRSGFALPFLFGTALGLVGGAVLGIFIAQRMFRLFEHVVTRVYREDSSEGIRLDLLLQ